MQEEINDQLYNQKTTLSLDNSESLKKSLKKNNKDPNFD
jgi:hypothetical protein